MTTMMITMLAPSAAKKSMMGTSGLSYSRGRSAGEALEHSWFAETRDGDKSSSTKVDTSNKKISIVLSLSRERLRRPPSRLGAELIRMTSR
ncbi:unnamed protein product [Vitrella brassicaformis CCMP3155]|uniref:Uncharacterized protein n=1 Tax=Vitrella brassicaformis (strain CCMP3155) TaxID=1169540 RepID=A0A0G4EAB6_VITBC|nr:unnamed protein product [Vitrella brassicaformis CCMP3155]|eukprot:CEL92173.1 unnamed protein product [Vitrella brassicaformis CCMP3155]